MLGIPDAADSDDGGEASGQFVTTQSCPRVHAGHDLDALQPHPLQIMVIEPIVGDDLQSKSYYEHQNTTWWEYNYTRDSLVPIRYDKYKPDKDFSDILLILQELFWRMPKKKRPCKSRLSKMPEDT